MNLPGLPEQIRAARIKASLMSPEPSILTSSVRELLTTFNADLYD